MSTKPRTAVQEQPRGNGQARGNTGLVSTVQDVTDGFMTLARNHMELAKAEARQEVKAYAQQAKFAAVGGVLAGFGALLLHAFGILLAAVLGGLLAAMWTSLIMAGFYLLVGGIVLGIAVSRAKKKDEAMHSTKMEIKRSSTWVKEIADNS